MIVFFIHIIYLLYCWKWKNNLLSMSIDSNRPGTGPARCLAVWAVGLSMGTDRTVSRARRDRRRSRRSRLTTAVLWPSTRPPAGLRTEAPSRPTSRANDFPSRANGLPSWSNDLPSPPRRTRSPGTWWPTQHRRHFLCTSGSTLPSWLAKFRQGSRRRRRRRRVTRRCCERGNTDHPLAVLRPRLRCRRIYHSRSTSRRRRPPGFYHSRCRCRRCHLWPIARWNSRTRGRRRARWMWTKMTMMTTRYVSRRVLGLKRQNKRLNDIIIWRAHARVWRVLNGKWERRRMEKIELLLILKSLPVSVALAEKRLY